MVNAILSRVPSVNDVNERISLRNEFMRAGMRGVIDVSVFVP
jgi:hypothetical protein